jgi:hypothetical protein
MERSDGFWSGRPRQGISPARPATFEPALEEAERLVMRQLEEMNRSQLGGRGAVSSRRSDWSPAVHVWQLWDDPRQERGAYIYVTLLLTSRGRPYIKVGRQAIPLDEQAERRLAPALRRAFAQPQFHAPVVDRLVYISRARFQTAGQPAGAGFPPGALVGQGRSAREREGTDREADQDGHTGQHGGDGPARQQRRETPNAAARRRNGDAHPGRTPARRDGRRQGGQ